MTHDIAHWPPWWVLIKDPGPKYKIAVEANEDDFVGAEDFIRELCDRLNKDEVVK